MISDPRFPKGVYKKIPDDNIKIATGAFGIGAAQSLINNKKPLSTKAVEKATVDGLVTVWAAFAKSPIGAFGRNALVGSSDAAYDIYDEQGVDGLTNFYNQLDIVKSGAYSGFGGAMGYGVTDWATRKKYNTFKIDNIKTKSTMGIDPKPGMGVGKANAFGNVVGGVTSNIVLPKIENAYKSKKEK